MIFIEGGGARLVYFSQLPRFDFILHEQGNIWDNVYIKPINLENIWVDLSI